MPRGSSVLSSHQVLFSEYRGPRILNEEGAGGDNAAQAQAKADADAKAKADADAKAKGDDGKKGDDTEGRISALAESNKALKKQLKDIEDAKKTEEEAKLLKKGEHETLLAQRNTELATERQAREQSDTKLKKYEEHAKKQIEESLKAIGDPEKQKTAQGLLAGKPVDDQITMLPEILKLVGATAANFGGATPAGTAAPLKGDEAKRSRFDALTEKLQKKEAMSPQEEREYQKLMMELSSFIPKPKS